MGRSQPIVVGTVTSTERISRTGRATSSLRDRRSMVVCHPSSATCCAGRAKRRTSHHPPSSRSDSTNTPSPQNATNQGSTILDTRGRNTVALLTGMRFPAALDIVRSGLKSEAPIAVDVRTDGEDRITGCCDDVWLEAVSTANVNSGAASMPTSATQAHV